MNGNKERDKDNPAAIFDHCDRIEWTFRRIGGSFKIFHEDADFRDAVLMNIVQIGEAAGRLSDDCREALCDLPWGSMIGTRNIIVHGYIQVSDQIIWDIVEKDISTLKARIEKEL